MEGFLKEYVRDGNMDISALKAALETVQPADLLRLLITIKHDSYTAIMVAANEGHTEACRLLLSPLRKTADELLWMKRKDGWTVLHIAACRGYSEYVELLMDTVSYERKYEFVAEKNVYGTTAIGVAAWCGSNKCIESLLNNFSSLQIEFLLNIQNNILYTPLHYAARNGETTALKVMLRSVSLVTASSLLNIKNRDQKTPLEEALFRGNKESSELLKRWPMEPVVEALDDARKQIKTLQIERDQKVSALQRHTQQQAEERKRPETISSTERK
ncbi:serine/threonine-protein phosphatase 6 regulatory ankyrin repeat subunit B-like [Watersipora subatra]|uniref:serine/threonine-protein phosphatase 6 regulatory ankyrin repeat subunit B-like n=1 Tax=Watersipora subatra TaxID=2589382 RepID=UPI00355B2313